MYLSPLSFSRPERCAKLSAIVYEFLARCPSLMCEKHFVGNSMRLPTFFRVWTSPLFLKRNLLQYHLNIACFRISFSHKNIKPVSILFWTTFFFTQSLCYNTPKIMVMYFSSVVNDSLHGSHLIAVMLMIDDASLFKCDESSESIDLSHFKRHLEHLTFFRDFF